jgi:arylsulfatase
MTHRFQITTVSLACLLAACATWYFAGGQTPAKAAAPSASVWKMDRTVLPIHVPVSEPITELDARNAKAPPRLEIKAPEKAPNVVIVLIDDFGFGHSSAFGGPIEMPTFEKLAQGGVRYNRFHTTALCSPTRVALLTGHNHHANNAGAIMELATAFPGNTGVRPKTITPLAEILRQNGYSTAAAGRRARASTSSMDSSAAKRISGLQRFSTGSRESNTRSRRTITSRPT